MLDRGGCTAEELRLLLGTLQIVRITTILVGINYRALQYMLPRQGRLGIFKAKAWLNFGKAARSDLKWLTHSLSSVDHNSASLEPHLTRYGMGWTLLAGPTSSGTVDDTAAPMAHKLKRTKGGKVVFTIADKGRRCGAALHGLTSRGGIREQTRRHTLKNSLRLCFESLARGAEQEGLYRGELVAKRIQRAS